MTNATLPPVVVTASKIAGDFKLSSFKSRFEPVRPNLFTATLSMGTNMSTLWNTIKDTFSFRVEGAEFPGRNISVSEIAGGGGPSVKIAQDVVYNDISLNIICSSDFKERKFFDAWFNHIYKDDYAAGSTYRGTFAYYEEYAKNNNLYVYQWDPSGKAIHSAICHEVFPTSMSAMTANWDERDTYQRFQVTFAYNKMTME